MFCFDEHELFLSDFEVKLCSWNASLKYLECLKKGALEWTSFNHPKEIYWVCLICQALDWVQSMKNEGESQGHKDLGKREHCHCIPFLDHGQLCRYSFLLSIFLNPVLQAANTSCLAVKLLALSLLLLLYLKVHLVKTDFLEKNILIKELFGWKMLEDIKSVVICFSWNDSLTFRDINWD